MERFQKDNDTYNIFKRSECRKVVRDLLNPAIIDYQSWRKVVKCNKDQHNKSYFFNAPRCGLPIFNEWNVTSRWKSYSHVFSSRIIPTNHFVEIFNAIVLRSFSLTFNLRRNLGDFSLVVKLVLHIEPEYGSTTK